MIFALHYFIVVIYQTKRALSSAWLAGRLTGDNMLLCRWKLQQERHPPWQLSLRGVVLESGWYTYFIISMPHNCRHCNFTFPHLHPKEKERKRFESRRKQQHIRFLASIRAGCLCAGDHCRAGIISKSCATQVQFFELFGIIISNAS